MTTTEDSTFREDIEFVRRNDIGSRSELHLDRILTSYESTEGQLRQAREHAEQLTRAAESQLESMKREVERTRNEVKGLENVRALVERDTHRNERISQLEKERDEAVAATKRWRHKADRDREDYHRELESMKRERDEARANAENENPDPVLLARIEELLARLTRYEEALRAIATKPEVWSRGQMIDCAVRALSEGSSEGKA